MKHALSDRRVVERMKSVIREQITSPFECAYQTDLLNLDIEEKAPSTDLIKARTLGFKALQTAED